MVCSQWSFVCGQWSVVSTYRWEITHIAGDRYHCLALYRGLRMRTLHYIPATDGIGRYGVLRAVPGCETLHRHRVM